MHGLDVVKRSRPVFEADRQRYETRLRDKIAAGRFLVIGGAGSIGRAVVREIFQRAPAVLHVVDLSENSLVELVRDLRSSEGYIAGDFQTFCIDLGSEIFDTFVRQAGGYDYVFNLAALKHVRSEKDPYSLMRLLEVNVDHALKAYALAEAAGAERYFCVSSDKAVQPASAMGASKRLMETCLMGVAGRTAAATARFANVAFSAGSLLEGFGYRLAKGQPLAAPQDVGRYFITAQESAMLCLLAGLIGGDREIFFPQYQDDLPLVTFAEVARAFLAQRGYTAWPCASEEEARQMAAAGPPAGAWPCYFFDSDTSGEKPYEAFYSPGESPDVTRFREIGVVAGTASAPAPDLAQVRAELAALKARGAWSKADLVALLEAHVPEFTHKETGRDLDQRM